MSAQPDYISFEPNGREELLSQIGGFSPAERSLFHRLCDSWAPRIDAQRLLQSSSTGAEQQRGALDRLMAKLRTAQIGVLTTRESESGLEPDEILLTSRGSAEYWCAVVNEAVEGLLRTDYRILPTEERMRAAKALPPDYVIIDADSSHLVSAYERTAEPDSVYRIRLMGALRVLFTVDTARDLILKGLTVLRRDLAERGLLEELARVKDRSITETRERLDSKAPDIWLDLTRTLVKERATIAYRKNIDEQDEIFQLAYLIMVFVDAQIGVARARRENAQVVDAELEELAAMVLNAPVGIVSRDEFATLVEEAGTRLGSAAATFTRRLTDEVLTPRPRRKLARVLYLHGLYIHAARVRSVFEQGRSEMSRQLSGEYADIMEAFLRGRTPGIGEIFGSRELFNADLRRRVERLHPLLGEFIARPQLLAEGIIQDAKQRREGVSTEELKGVLADYFDVDSSALRPLQDLFGIDLVALFDDAFARTSVFRQILLRLSGRYESLRATYTRRFGQRAQQRTSFADNGEPERSVRTSSPTPASPEEPVGLRTEGTAGRRTTDPPGRRRPTPRQVRPRRKSHHEIEHIWQEFDKALRTRPSEEDPS